MSRPRPFVIAPDGRRYSGIWPQNLGSDGEAPFIAALARQVGGVPEVTLPVGRADVATNTHVFEVEPARSWRVGARQAFSYGGMTGLVPVLAVFGRIDYLDLYLRVRDRIPGLLLWRWDCGRWTPVTSRAAARKGSA
jgi:hypothetical protein